MEISNITLIELVKKMGHKFRSMDELSMFEVEMINAGVLQRHSDDQNTIEFRLNRMEAMLLTVKEIVQRTEEASGNETISKLLEILPVIPKMEDKVKDIHQAIFEPVKPVPKRLSQKDKIILDLNQRKEKERIRIITKTNQR